MRFDQTIPQPEVRKAWDALTLAAAWSRDDLQDGVIFGLLLDTGMRPREAANLEWRAMNLVNEAGGYLEIPQAYAKRGRSRQVALTLRLDALLILWANAHKPRKWDWDPDWMFPGQSGRRPISVRTVQRAVSRWARTHLGRPLHPYVLRHTYATQMLRVANIRVVQDALGHRSITSTQVYTHVAPQDILDGTRAYEAATTRAVPAA